MNHCLLMDSQPNMCLVNIEIIQKQLLNTILSIGGNNKNIGFSVSALPNLDFFICMNYNSHSLQLACIVLALVQGALYDSFLKWNTQFLLCLFLKWHQPLDNSLTYFLVVWSLLTVGVRQLHILEDLCVSQQEVERFGNLLQKHRQQP